MTARKRQSSGRWFTTQRRILPPTLLLAVGLLAGWSERPVIRVFLVGDSTMADKPTNDNPERGWGQMLTLYFDDGVKIENHARNGRSTKSFLREGRWKSVCEEIKTGDYVFIQFGHNDGKITDTNRYAAPHGAYKDNLIRFVKDARERGAIPVLLTPVQRRKFGKDGRLVDTHGEYPGVVREVAADEHVALIDMTQESTGLLNKLGEDGSKSLYMSILPEMFSSMPAGKTDNTHFTKSGAITIAGLVVDALRQSHLPLKDHLRSFDPSSLAGLNKVVTLDYFYNCEWKEIAGKKVQFHYIWEDTANSGFSQLGTIIDGLGAYASEMKSAPTSASLSRSSVYVIVDPDTPKETERPNYIEDSAIAAIVGWVKEGGVLVLMGNDKGNAEFAHLNRLAGQFGIHFNEDSFHRVVGNDFETGKFANLPAHPIFSGMTQIYLKEICSLSLQNPAEAVLRDREGVFMASSRVGKGLVFAVGDPWLYNEYMDSRKLPSSYENAKAGENLFRWLLQQSKPVMN